MVTKITKISKMEEKDTIRINVALPTDVHKNAKIKAINKGMKLKEYIVFCINKENEHI